MNYDFLNEISDVEILPILLKKLSDEDLILLLETVLFSVNERFSLFGLADSCEFNIKLKNTNKKGVDFD